MANINEIVINTPSTDFEFVEIIGNAGEDISNLSLLEITDTGAINDVISLAGQSVGEDGFFLASSPAAETQYGVTGDLQFSNNTFTNNTSTYLLVEGFTGAVNDDLDTEDDGTLDDPTPWSAIIDSIAFVEPDGEATYATPVFGPTEDGFLPAGAFRDENGDFQTYEFNTVGDEATPEGEALQTTTVSIMEIQGESQTSPLLGDLVKTTGVVTAVDSNGFYFQDPEGDNNVATSDALFVFTGGEPTVSVGNSITVEGTVSEFFPGGEGTGNLSTTQISGATVTVDEPSTDVFPGSTIIGEGGRIPPSQNIDDDAFAEFNPTEAGIDFFESLEGMLVTAQEALAVAPTNRFGEIFTVTDNGANATGISDRGTLNISPDDFNPEKVQIDADSGILPDFDFPDVNVGASLGDVTGVVGYGFGNFEVYPTEPFEVTESTLEAETTNITSGEERLTFASYNVLNLDPVVEDVDSIDPTEDDPEGEIDDDIGNGRFTAISEQIVNNLNAPDIIALQEIQDNDGAELTNVGDADVTLQTLVDAIAQAGGPTYEFIDTPGIVPAFIDEDGDLVRPTGGQPGGNIRNAFLYNSERADLVEESVQPLTDPQDQATNPENPFFGGRIPLAATFEFSGEEITLVNNHLSSKGGSSPILGVEQPFEERQEEVEVNGSLDERTAQANAVNDFINNILTDDPNANVVALGDFNEFEFVSPVETILGENLTNLTDTIGENERYSFIFQGNSQQLDHILVSDNLAEQAQFDIVHSNAEFPDTPEKASDHEPLLASVNLAQEVEPTDMTINLNPIGTFETGVFDEGAAEIVAYDAGTERLFVINSDAVTVDILNVSDPTNPTLIDQIDATEFGDGANSVAVQDGIVAVAIEAEAIDANGQIVFFDTDGNVLNTVEAGVLPDMVTFSPDDTKVLVANEGEPNDDYTIDPEGSVSVIDISEGVENATVSNAGFTAFNDQEEALVESGVRIFGPNATVAQDVEPEYITFNADSTTAYVSLQENNALAVVDLESAEVTDILPLGFKDHSQSGNELDPSDNDDGINIRNIPTFGMLQPDSIDAFEVDGQTFIITANEGDARDFDGFFSEEARLDDLLEDGLLDLNNDGDADDENTEIEFQGETITLNDLLADDFLGDLDLTSATGDLDDDGLIEQLFSFGGRSFSIFNESGEQVFDSGDDFERITAELIPDDFNSDNEENDSFDSRSDAKGPEPEAIVTGVVDGTPYAFIGLERVGGIMVYDLSNPSEPEFVQYVNNRDFSVDFDENEEGDPNPTPEQLSQAGDLGPEGFEFISAEDSPNGEPLLAVGNEVSGTTTIYSVADMAQEETFSLQLLHAADQEGGLPAVEDAVNFSAVIEALADQSENTLRLSSGDIYIPGPFFNASSELYGEPGIGDVLINNALGFQAVTFGNHEFDQGTEVIRNLIEANPEITGPGIGEEGFQGAAFPYLSANLDFSEDENLSDLVVEGGQAPQPNTISSSTVIDVNGEQIGVVGATTPTLEDISSPGDVIVQPTNDDVEELAAIIQEEVDSLTAQGINKIILSAHFQQLSIEEEVASLLDDVDIVIAGGSNTLLANEDDPLRAGDTAEGPFPREVDSDGETVFLVNTDGNYKYVGQLIADFDAEGNVISIGDDSGAFATDIAGVERLLGEGADPAEFADETIVEVTNAIGDLTLDADGNVFGQTEVFLNGTRGDVRTQETNLGNLTADANLEITNQLLSEGQQPATISLKNGGGIRDNIGSAIVPAGGTTGELELLPPQANPAAGKEEGEISQLDIENALRFNNGLVQLTLTLEELELILEHAVEETEEGATPGRFPQVSGVNFSFDAEQTPIEFEFDGDGNNTGEVATDGERIREITILDETGEESTIFEDGEFVVDSAQEVRIVTLNFLADGGDGFPFDVFGENRIDFVEQFGDNTNPDDLPEGTTNAAEFAAVGSEQDALAEFLAQNFPVDGDVAFSEEDTPATEDTRIINLPLEDEPTDEEAPLVEDATFDVEENSAVETVGTVTVADAQGDDFTLALSGDLDVDGDGDDAFAIDDTGLITVNDSDDIDFETQQSFNFEVTAEDTDGNIGTGNVTVDLINDPSDDPEPSELQSDFTGDGIVNLDDLGVFAAAFGTSDGGANFNATADLSGDGLIDLNDLGIFAAEFGSSVA